MRGCGLRVRGALAVSGEDFRDGGTTLRCSGQASQDGTRKVPLKHRRAGEYRDIPVPAYLWAMINDRPDGPVCPGTGTTYQTYSTVYRALVKGEKARHPGWPLAAQPPSCFRLGPAGQPRPITDVADWFGHREIGVTSKTYCHLIPSAAGKAKAVLDAESQSWSAA